MIEEILVGFFSFTRNCIGLVTKPYITCRRIAGEGSLWELLPIGMVLSAYFATASLVKTASFRPYLLTKQFVLLAFGAGMSFIFLVSALFIASQIVKKGCGSLRALVIAWAYTLLPTVSWFFMTSILYVILPPPRTTELTGMMFSVWYVIISSVFLFWKINLSYLALRFSMRLDLFRILGVMALAGPVIALYCIALYRFGIFKVPFI